MERGDLTRLRTERPGGMEFLRETLTRDAAGTLSRSLLKRLVYKRADMAHADPISTCHPRLLATDAWAVTQDKTKRDAAGYKTPAQSLKVPGTGVPMGGGCANSQEREGLDFLKEKRDVPLGLWVFLPALGLTVDHWWCQI